MICWFGWHQCVQSKHLPGVLSIKGKSELLRMVRELCIEFKIIVEEVSAIDNFSDKLSAGCQEIKEKNEICFWR